MATEHSASGGALQFALDNNGNPVALTSATDSAGNDAGNMIASGFGLKGVAHNRNIDDAVQGAHPGTDASNTATWASAENVREITLKAVEVTAGDLQTTDAFLVIVNAPSAAAAKAWLEDNTTDYTQDVLYEMAYFGESLTIQRTSAITRVDVLPISGVNMRVVISGVGV